MRFCFETAQIHILEIFKESRIILTTKEEKNLDVHLDS